MQRVVTLRAVWSATALSVFLATEIAVVTAAAIWALVGLMHLGTTTASILAALIGLPALYAIVVVVTASFRAETDPENV